MNNEEGQATPVALSRWGFNLSYIFRSLNKFQNRKEAYVMVRLTTA